MSPGLVIFVAAFVVAVLSFFENKMALNNNRLTITCTRTAKSAAVSVSHLANRQVNAWPPKKQMQQDGLAAAADR